MKILVIGGNGYLGNKIIRELIKDKANELICTCRKPLEQTVLANLSNDIKVVPTSCDAVQTVLQYTEIDVIINMICNYGRNNYLYDNVIDANITIPLNILNLAALNGVKKYITIGTGLPDDFNMYSFSKKILSDFGSFYANKCGISFVDVQLEMFYGSDEPTNRFIPDIITKMLHGLEVNTTVGTQKRDIISVDDVIYALKSIVYAEIEGYKIIPVGTGVAPTISEIVDYIWELTGEISQLNKGVIPMRANEPDSVADLSEIRKYCDWNPIEWKIGISKMINELKYKQEGRNIK